MMRLIRLGRFWRGSVDLCLSSLGDNSRMLLCADSAALGVEAKR